MQREGLGGTGGEAPSTAPPCTTNIAAPFVARDAEYLRRRGVPLEAAAAAGLRTVDADTAARMLGHPTHLPSAGLAIPYPGVSPSYTRVRMHSGDVRFYAPAGREVPVYVPPSMNGLSDPAADLIVVEGPIKALALASAGFTTVGLGGTGTTLTKKSGARFLNSSWSAVPLDGRRVVVLFDAGRALNPNVARDEARLAAALERAGAVVFAASLPLAEHGRDQGPDDFLALRGKETLESVLRAAVPASPVARCRAALATEDEKARFERAVDLLSDKPFLASVVEGGEPATLLVAAELKSAGVMRSALSNAIRALRESDDHTHALGTPSADAQETYRVLDGAYVHVTPEGGSSPICNFTAEIIEDRLVDDGTEQVRRFTVRGETASGRVLPSVELSPEDFERSTWPLDKWGSAASLSAGRGMAHHLRAAMQLMSTPREITVYTHTGWTKIDGRWRFLHAGDHANHGNVRVDLEGALARYQLPDPPVDLTPAWDLVGQFLGVADQSITYPLLCAAFRAPLQSIHPVDFTLFLEGQSGSLKSTLAALALNFFGDSFDGSHLPLDWSATAASIEYRLSIARDVLVVIDDFAPRSSDPHDDLRRKADQVLRSIGNQSARSRMRADMTAHPDRIPRSLVIATGEDLPSGESILARLVPIHVERGLVSLSHVSLVQQNARALSQIMSAYIGWLLPQHDDLRSLVDSLFEHHRRRFSDQAAHLRGPSALAHLAIGAELFMRFAQDRGLASATEASAFMTNVCRALASLSSRQSDRVADADPVDRFLVSLRSLLAQGRAHVSHSTNEPLAPSIGSEPIGWADDESSFLLPEPTYRVVVRAMREAGESFPLNAPTLWRRVKSKGLLPLSDHEHFTCKRTLGQRRQRVLALATRLLSPKDEAA